MKEGLPRTELLERFASVLQAINFCGPNSTMTIWAFLNHDDRDYRYEVQKALRQELLELTNELYGI